MYDRGPRAKPPLAQQLLLRRLPAMGISSSACGVQLSNSVICDFHLQTCWTAFTAILECMHFSGHRLDIANRPFHFGQAWLNETKPLSWLTDSKKWDC